MSDYIVVSWAKVAALIAVIAALGCLLIWFGIFWMDSYDQQMAELIEASPEQAAIEISNHLRIIAIVQLIVMLPLAVLLAWYGVRGLSTRSMPPRGAWIVTGTPIRTGSHAVRAAWILIACAVAVAVLAVFVAVTIWRLVPI